MKAEFGSCRTHVRRRRVGTSTTGAPDWKLFFGSGGRWNDCHCGRAFWRCWLYDVERAQKRFMPASTFKVPHALFVLDAGAVRDAPGDSDGVKRDFDGWNQDQTLRSSMRHSTVWVYQQFAREIGEVREKEYLTLDSVWQRRPVRRCRSLCSTATLPDFSHGTGGFPAKTVSKRASVQGRASASGQGYHDRRGRARIAILRAKTGWQARVEPQIGWWVGWVETPTGAVIFALNIDLPGGKEGCAETGRRLSDRYSSRSEHFRAETCTGFSRRISPLQTVLPPLRNWMRSSRS